MARLLGEAVVRALIHLVPVSVMRILGYASRPDQTATQEWDDKLSAQGKGRASHPRGTFGAMRWRLPSGLVQRFTDLSVNRYTTLVEEDD